MRASTAVDGHVLESRDTSLNEPHGEDRSRTPILGSSASAEVLAAHGVLVNPLMNPLKHVLHLSSSAGCLQTLSWTLTLKLPHCSSTAPSVMRSAPFSAWSSLHGLRVHFGSPSPRSTFVLQTCWKHTHLCFERPATALRAGLSWTEHTVDFSWSRRIHQPAARIRSDLQTVVLMR